MRESGWRRRAGAGAGALLAIGQAAWGAGPWAAEIVSFDPGVGAVPGYDNPAAALGRPARFTGKGIYPGAVTPFNPPWGTDEIVSIGEGGWLTVRFGTPVRDNPAHPFGIDLLVFGNAGLIDFDWPNGLAGGLFGAGGVVEVSTDGADWRPVPGVPACGLFPTLGYADLADPYDTAPGNVRTDFRLPVDPAFDPVGKTFGEIVSAYAGSGGGAGIDLAAVGLGEASFVRISNPGGEAVEIDAFARVRIPAPGAACALCVGFIARRRRRSP